MIAREHAYVGTSTATFMVIANMIGTGVFTSLGFQVVNIRSGFPIVLLWVLGGVVALCGALTYGELGTTLPRSGGEYHLLSRIVHPFPGFLSGWVSATVGFAAPTALAAIALASYLHTVFPSIHVVHTAALAVVVFTVLHCLSIRWGTRFTDVLTVIKVLLLLIFIGWATRVPVAQNVSVWPVPGDFRLLTTADFAVSLIYVSYAYTGWNAAIYIVGEMKEAERLPRALVTGTLIVLVLYTLVNYAFMYTVPFAELSGQVEVGYLSATKIFGERGGNLMSLVIAVILTSTISVMIYIGPRIMQVMGEDMRLLRPLAYRTAGGIPLTAVLVQGAVTLTFIYTATFQQVLLYAGFTLSLITSLTVSTIFVLRRREPDRERPYRTWGYPWPPILFLAPSLWSLVYMMIDKPVESVAGLATLALGAVIYFIDRMRFRESNYYES